MSSPLQSWHEEKQSAWLYRVMAKAEADTERSALFDALARSAEQQAAIWQRRVEKEGSQVPPFAADLRARFVAVLVRRFGVRPLRRVLAAMKVRGLSIYDHRFVGHHAMPASVEDVGRHHRGIGRAGNLRAAVFGVNDGLVSNTSLIMGVAGASAGLAPVVTAGIAGLLAGALSMAAGEYVSVRSQREFYEFQIGLEREELEEYPAEEAEELALIYHARGLSLDQARATARGLMSDPANALATLAREELGLNPDDLGSPWGAAFSSFFSFTGGAVIPLLPFLLGGGGHAVRWSAVLAGLGLFSVGCLLSLFTGRGALASGLRMVLIGGGAGVVTYLIGLLIGAGLVH